MSFLQKCSFYKIITKKALLFYENENILLNIKNNNELYVIKWRVYENTSNNSSRITIV